MYRVSFTIEGHAREYFPGAGEDFELDLPGPASIREMILLRGVSPDLVMTVFVNGRLAGKDDVPPCGAEVILLTPPAGG